MGDRDRDRGGRDGVRVRQVEGFIGPCCGGAGVCVACVSVGARSV